MSRIAAYQRGDQPSAAPDIAIRISLGELG